MPGGVGRKCNVKVEKGTVGVLEDICGDISGKYIWIYQYGDKSKCLPITIPKKN